MKISQEKFCCAYNAWNVEKWGQSGGILLAVKTQWKFVVLLRNFYYKGPLRLAIANTLQGWRVEVMSIMDKFNYSPELGKTAELSKEAGAALIDARHSEISQEDLDASVERLFQQWDEEAGGQDWSRRMDKRR